MIKNSTILRDVIGTNHRAEEMRLARSVLQLCWVKSGRCLYAPLAVKRCAYAHITVVDISRKLSGVTLS